MPGVRYRCPDCGFQVFNRRIAKCEACGAGLPPEFLLSREQISVLDAEHKKSLKEREARARASRGGGDSGGGDSGLSWDFGGDGDGGGGD